MNIVWGKAVDFLVSVVGPSVVDRWQQTSAVGSSMSRLQDALTKAHLLIERSECWRLPKYRPIDELLTNLKDAVYDAESIVDELEYQRLKNEVEKGSPGIAKTFVMNWMNGFPETVTGVLDRLNKEYIEMEKHCNRHGIHENPNQFSQTARPVTSTILKAPTVYGREKEFQEVISLLGVPNSRSSSRKRRKKLHVSNLSIGESSSSMDNNGKVSVLSIVGMGGVGKTTLAQMVCNENRVKSHFDLIMWVCVSDNFDVVRLTKEIIESATKKDCNITNLHALQVTLQETLYSNRFLLILDDVWSKDWQSLLAPMKSVVEGSVVMVTTRSLECVDISGVGIDSKGVINLEGLEEKIYWDFFRSCAFGSVEDANKYPELEIIGKEICDRLKGSPLAAKTIGGLLRTIMDERHWNGIKDSKIWKLEQGEYDILPVLQLSYRYLPSHIKKCFSFCSLYPKDYKFKKWELTKLWIMQGFIELQPELNIYWENPYIIEAEVCFNELVQRCFFQKAAGSGSHEYVIHDLMHDVCQSITKDECFCIEDADFGKNANFNIRHLSIFRKGRINKEEQEKFYKFEKLLSLRVVSQSSCWSNVINRWCEKLANICSLSVSRCKFERLPKSIGRLKHLQYLDISFSLIREFPESFWSLYNLLYLNMEGCSNFIFSREEIMKLVNLRFLYIPVHKLILVGHMENVARKIDCKDMSLEVSAHGKIEYLKFMNNLKGRLTIKNLELVLSKQTAEEAHLNNKQFIDRLSLCWSMYEDPTGGQSAGVERRDEEVLQGLCPHPDIKELIIFGYGGGNLSRSGWLGPKYLAKLQILVIENCPELVLIAVELFGQFVFLEKLTISNCPKLTWPNAMVLPPSMKSLLLSSCGDLVESTLSFLQNLSSLEDLSIANCPSLVSIPAEVTKNLKSLKKFCIFECAALESLNGLQFMAALGHLELKYCPRLASITADVLRNLKSLSELYIEKCAGLKSIEGLGFLVSLQKLEIKSCPSLISIQADVASNLKSLSVLHVALCAELQSLGGLLHLTSVARNIYLCPKLQWPLGKLQETKGELSTNQDVISIKSMSENLPVVASHQQNSVIDNNLSNLCAMLPKGHVLIERTECWCIPKYNSLNKLFLQLKDAVYEAETMVIECEYQGLKNKIESSLDTKFLGNRMNHLPTTVKGVLDRLNDVYNEMKETCDRRGIPEDPNQLNQTAKPTTSTFLNASIVYGREKELSDIPCLMGIPDSASGENKRLKKVHLSNLDTGESSIQASTTDKNRNVLIISIVGMGGAGKTTLAQMIYKEECVSSYFDPLMWVNVPDNLDKVRFTKEILEMATKKDCNLTNLIGIQMTLQETLKSKRFLVILDDVRNKDWQYLLSLMNEASEGSVVLVTTRFLESVELLDTSMNPRVLIKNIMGLEKHIYWEFFKACAFPSVINPNNHPEIQKIGEEICDKLNGSPLAAKAIGHLLRTDVEIEHWRNIRDNKMWQLQQKEHDDIPPALLLSYQYLPSHLKKCLSFIALYPKRFKFTKIGLVNFWIKQGFITPLDDLQKLETQAENYFFDLLRRCFLKNDPLGSYNEYVLDDKIHDFCRSITNNECFCKENEDFEQKVMVGTRHISIFQENLEPSKQNELCKYKKLLSLSVAHPSSCSYSAIGSWCEKLTSILSLSLSGCKVKELPENIGNLKHLQYLDISGTSIEKLPMSFCSLYNLKYLNMTDCSNIECFPKEATNLVNLQLFYLLVEKFSLVGYMKNLARAIQRKDTQLCVKTCQIENLKHMSKLTGSLHIQQLEVVPGKEAAEEARLNNKPFISCLHLNWQNGEQFVSNGHNYDEVLQGLCPHPNLKILKIEYFGGRNLSPSWLKEKFLPNLTEVSIKRCLNDFTISHLPRFITKLSIDSCPRLTSLQNILGPVQMPELRHLNIFCCEELVSLPLEEFGNFVRLKWLALKRCPKLFCPRGAVLPPSLKNLSLESCGDLEKSIPGCLRNLTSLEELEISHCQRLVSIPAQVTTNLKYLSSLHILNCEELESVEELRFLVSLQHLHIGNCPRLTSIPAEVTSYLKDLTSLFVENCPELKSISELQFLASLRHRSIYNCPNLEETGGQDIHGTFPSDFHLQPHERKRAQEEKETESPQQNAELDPIRTSPDHGTSVELPARPPITKQYGRRNRKLAVPTNIKKI